VQRSDKKQMSKIANILILGMIFSNGFLWGMGNMTQELLPYKAVFSSSSSSGYFIADISDTYQVKNVQTMGYWVNKKAEFSSERYSERIVALLEYNQKIIQITVYGANTPGETASSRGHDIYLIDNSEKRMILSLGSNTNRQSQLAFSKIIGDTLFIGLDEPYRTTNIIAIQLDEKEYPILKYSPNMGIIENVWILDDKNLLYTSCNDNKRESGILRIANNGMLELIESLDY
jgi:hypothetical protein